MQHLCPPASLSPTRALAAPCCSACLPSAACAPLGYCRGYRNPEFFAKMVDFLEIQQYGTSFPPDVWDPSALPPEDYLDALAKEWAAEEERRKAARAAGQGRVEFAKSGAWRASCWGLGWAVRAC